MNARVANSGQTCIAPKRAIVEKSVKAARMDNESHWNSRMNEMTSGFQPQFFHFISFAYSDPTVFQTEAAFEQKVVEKISRKKYGVDYGPLVHPVGRDQVAKQVVETQSQGAKLLCGGPDVKVPTSDCGKSGP